MSRITIYQVKDNGAKVKITFDADDCGDMYISNVTNIPKKIIGEIRHLNQYSELIVLDDGTLDCHLEKLIDSRKKEKQS